MTSQMTVGKKFSLACATLVALAVLLGGYQAVQHGRCAGERMEQHRHRGDL